MLNYIKMSALMPFVKVRHYLLTYLLLTHSAAAPLPENSTAVERRSLAGELSPSYARPAADG